MKNKRKTYVIDRSFQYRMIGLFLLWILIAFVIFSAGAVLYYWISSMAGENIFNEFITINERVFETKENPQGEMVRVPTTKATYGVKRWEIVVPPLLINNLLIMLVVAVMGVFYSHRIVGPVYRINRDLQRVLDGEYDVTVELREDDQFHELAGRVNSLLRDFYAMKKRIDSTAE